MRAHDDLLRRFRPQLRYDSIEQYFADSPVQWTDNPGNELRRADEPSTTEAWYDLADGKRAAREPRLDIVDRLEGWSAWPGTWGDTRPRRPGGVDQPSPVAPCVHRQWSDPDALLATAREPSRRDAPSAPDVVVSRDRGFLAIQLDLSRHPPPPPVASP